MSAKEEPKTSASHTRIKLGFSSLACPAWDLATIISSAKQFGYDGVELRGLRNDLYLPLTPELTGDPDHVKSVFRDGGVELVCLGSSATLTATRHRELAKAKEEILDYMELAGKLGCPNVRIMVGETGRGEDRLTVLGRLAESLRSMMSAASRLNVRLLIENGGDFCSATDLWFLADAVNHPMLRCCWNQCQGMTQFERATNALPRLGSKIGLVHICDATFNADVLVDYKLPGEGDLEAARQIEILKGLAFDGYVVFEWPRRWVDRLAAPETALPAAAKFLRDCINEKQPILTAYKGDKNAPKFMNPAKVHAAS